MKKKMKIYPQLVTFVIKPQIWLFYVVFLQTTAQKWTKVKNARAGRAKLLFLPTKYTNFLTFSLSFVRELKQRQRRRQTRERHKFAYLVGKNNSFACPARAFFTFVRFAAVSKTTT